MFNLEWEINFLPLLNLWVIMKCYGYLFGKIKLIKDLHHDEVFVERNGHVIIRNNHYLVTYKDMVAIARELGVNPNNNDGDD